LCDFKAFTRGGAGGMKMVYSNLSRKEFINEVANWLPEWKYFYLRILKLESEGIVRLIKDDGIAKVISNITGQELAVFAEG